MRIGSVRLSASGWKKKLPVSNDKMCGSFWQTTDGGEWSRRMDSVDDCVCVIRQRAKGSRDVTGRFNDPLSWAVGPRRIESHPWTVHDSESNQNKQRKWNVNKGKKSRIKENKSCVVGLFYAPSPAGRPAIITFFFSSSLSLSLLLFISLE